MNTGMVEGQLADQMRLHGRAREEVVAGMVAGHPVPRFVETEEVAAMIAFLASEASSGINGACIPIDLGASAG
jgi:3-hydroxybutyrate dehydrogenase